MQHQRTHYLSLRPFSRQKNARAVNPNFTMDTIILLVDGYIDILYYVYISMMDTSPSVERLYVATFGYGQL